ncbi:HAD family hydrolase [Candidatus Thorarchaeota archaeon]|nr:MAG: HAD family hydrolase [Candidatus Thorarchaeota archaeon]
MLKGAVFDLDGTITVLTLPLDAMREDAKAYFVSQGLPPEMLEPADGISSSTLKAKKYFRQQGGSEEEWARMMRELDEVLNQHEGHAAEDVRLIEGAFDAVDQVRAMGLRTAILTNNGRHAVDIVLKNVPLDDYFDVIQTRNESPNPKPYPDGILLVVEKLELFLDEAIYIGDARIDGAAAQRAGIEFWGVTSGETHAEDLLKAGASRVFQSLREIPEAIRERNKSND